MLHNLASTFSRKNNAKRSEMQKNECHAQLDNDEGKKFYKACSLINKKDVYEAPSYRKRFPYF